MLLVYPSPAIGNLRVRIFNATVSASHAYATCASFVGKSVYEVAAEKQAVLIQVRRVRPSPNIIVSSRIFLCIRLLTPRLADQVAFVSFLEIKATYAFHSQDKRHCTGSDTWAAEIQAFADYLGVAETDMTSWQHANAIDLGFIV